MTGTELCTDYSNLILITPPSSMTLASYINLLYVCGLEDICLVYMSTFTYLYTYNLIYLGVLK